MADIPSAIDKMNTDEVAQDKPLTEALFTKIGANINGLIDDVVEEDLVDRVEDLEGRVDDATGVTIYTSPWLLPEDIGFTNEIEEIRVVLLISNADEYFIGYFGPGPVGGSNLPSEVWNIQNPYLNDTPDGVNEVLDVANRFVDLRHSFRSGRYHVRYKIIEYVDV